MTQVDAKTARAVAEHTFLTSHQRDAIRHLASLRPVAGNDDGWVSGGGVSRSTLRSLVKNGYLIQRLTGAHAHGSQNYMLTAKARAIAGA
jgi:hypothetical protein